MTMKKSESAWGIWPHGHLFKRKHSLPHTFVPLSAKEWVEITRAFTAFVMVVMTIFGTKCVGFGIFWQ